MKLGDYVKVLDGRIGTVVYNGLDGIGIVFGKIKLSKEDRNEILSACPLFKNGKPEGYRWQPTAMLRDKTLTSIIGMECVGEESQCEILGADEK